MAVIRTARLDQVDLEKYIAYASHSLGRQARKTSADFFRGTKEVGSSKYEVPKSVVDSIKKDKYE